MGIQFLLTVEYFWAFEQGIWTRIVNDAEGSKTQSKHIYIAPYVAKLKPVLLLPLTDLLELSK